MKMSRTQKNIEQIRHRSRLRKYYQLIDLLKPSDNDTILEVGVANKEYSNVDNFIIKQYPYQERITALGIGDLSLFRLSHQHVRAVTYDGQQFPFDDDTFTIAHANAVIEHVGPRALQKAFLREMVRVSERGMITTPNRFFPIETHTKIPLLHMFGKNVFDAILKMIGKAWAADGYMHLLGIKDLDELARASGLTDYRIIRNKLFFFTMTFTLVWSKNMLWSHDDWG
jgi:hypothetical protein